MRLWPDLRRSLPLLPLYESFQILTVWTTCNVIEAFIFCTILIWCCFKFLDFFNLRKSWFFISTVFLCKAHLRTGFAYFVSKFTVVRMVIFFPVWADRGFMIKKLVYRLRNSDFNLRVSYWFVDLMHNGFCYGTHTFVFGFIYLVVGKSCTFVVDLGGKLLVRIRRQGLRNVFEFAAWISSIPLITPLTLANYLLEGLDQHPVYNLLALFQHFFELLLQASFGLWLIGNTQPWLRLHYY